MIPHLPNHFFRMEMRTFALDIQRETFSPSLTNFLFILKSVSDWGDSEYES